MIPLILADLSVAACTLCKPLNRGADVITAPLALYRGFAQHPLTDIVFWRNFWPTIKANGWGHTSRIIIKKAGPSNRPFILMLFISPSSILHGIRAVLLLSPKCHRCAAVNDPVIIAQCQRYIMGLISLIFSQLPPVFPWLHACPKWRIEVGIDYGCANSEPKTPPLVMAKVPPFHLFNAKLAISLPGSRSLILYSPLCGAVMILHCAQEEQPGHWVWKWQQKHLHNRDKRCFLFYSGINIGHLHQYSGHRFLKPMTWSPIWRCI